MPECTLSPTTLCGKNGRRAILAGPGPLRLLNFDALFYALVTNDLVWAQEQIEEST